MPSIIITNVRNVSVNGSPVGALVNAFQEAQDPVAVQLALESFCDNVESAHAAALAVKEAQLADQATEANLARQAATEEHAAALAAKDASKTAAVEAAKLAIQTNLDALVTAAEAAHASGDLDAIGAVIAQAKGYTTAARKAKIEADLAAAQAAAAAHAAALAALA